MKKLELKAYAKINIALDICGVKPDGFHEISTVMQHIDLHDIVCVRWMPGGGGIAVETHSNRRYLPEDRRNIVYKAAELVAGRYDILEKYGPGKVRIDIKKQIPVSAGLGGGSADGAATLRALSSIWELGLDIKKLCALGAELGSDVPFCVMGQAGTRCCLAEGVGTDLTPLRGLNSWIVLSKPPISVSTAAAYQGYDSIADGNFERPDIGRLIAAMEEDDLASAAANMVNVLENYTLKAYPGVAKTKQEMLERTSPLRAVMSGSGPTMIGFYRDKASAETAFSKMALVNRETFLAKTLI